MDGWLDGWMNGRMDELHAMSMLHDGSCERFGSTTSVPLFMNGFEYRN